MLRSGLLVQLILVAGVALGQWPGQEGDKLPWWMDPDIIDFDPTPPRVPEADARKMSIVRLKQGGKYLAMEDRKFKMVDSETACADMEQFVMTMDRWGEYGSIHPLHPELTTCRGHAYVLDIWKGPRVVGLYRKGWGTNQYWQWHEYGNKMVSKWTGSGKHWALAWKSGHLKVEELSEDSSPNQEWEIEELYHELNGTYAEYPGLSLPTERTFAIQNTGSGLMASIGKKFLSTVEGQCEEFTFKPVDGAWGTIHPVSKPGKALDYWTRAGKIGLWRTHRGSNQLWKLAGDHLVTKRRYKVATPGSDGIIQMVKASCGDSEQHWQIHDSCTSGPPAPEPEEPQEPVAPEEPENPEEPVVPEEPTEPEVNCDAAKAKYCPMGDDNTMCQYCGIDVVACNNPGPVFVNQLTQAEKDEIVAYHNLLRGRIANGVDTNWASQMKAANMNKLVWNDELAEFAQVWANQCGNGHDTNRKSPDFDGFNGQGQNAASFWTTSDQPGQLHQSGNFADFRQAAVQQWYEEVRDLPEDATLESYGDDSFGDKTTGHYTQVVWAETKMVGCGAISFKEKLNGKEYFAKRYVCNYYPPGNFLGNPVYIETEGEAGEACPNGTENGLCL